MKYLIISDIHGSSFHLNNLLKKDIDYDKLVILGDILYHGPRNDLPEGYNPKEIIKTLNNLKDKIIAIRGNCDADVDLMVLDFEISNFKWLKINEKLLYLTHGHKHNKDLLPCKRRKYTLLHGHTHVNVVHKASDKVRVVNIGSLSIPKDGYYTYAVIDGNNLTVFNLLTDDIILSLEV